MSDIRDKAAKAMKYATEVAFGEVCAKKTDEWDWCVFDSRPVRQGARMVRSHLTQHSAVAEAHRLSNLEPESDL